MAAFAAREIDWRRPDVVALLRNRGLLTVPIGDGPALGTWLAGQGYHLLALDGSAGFQELLRQIGELFEWQARFGYRLEDAGGGLDAIRDGFQIQGEEGGRVALVMGHVDALPPENRNWVLAFLSIAMEESLHQLALGRRFLLVLPLEPDSSFPGAVVESAIVPHPGTLLLPSG
jgi:hypothetical protein